MWGDLKRGVMILLMFWNLENFFDPFEGEKGNEFTPAGERHWTWKKFCSKRDLVAKIILSTHDRYNVYPSVIGLCEVENLFVLRQLTQKTILKALGYNILHRESEDKRGIDVAILYRDADVTVLSEQYFPAKEELSQQGLQTRYVLYAKCLMNLSGDTLHVFANHWPSKIGSNKEAEVRRQYISNKVRQKCDSILHCVPNSKIVLMGDFNDTPDSKSVRSLAPLINLAATQSNHLYGNGSYKFRESWEAIDQFIVSDSSSLSMEVYLHPALLIYDKIYLGKKIRRTYNGPKYIGGASDHLPITLMIRE